MKNLKDCLCESTEQLTAYQEKRGADWFVKVTSLDELKHLAALAGVGPGYMKVAKEGFELHTGEIISKDNPMWVCPKESAFSRRTNVFTWREEHDIDLKRVEPKIIDADNFNYDYFKNNLPH